MAHKILIVDDDKGFQKLLEIRLKSFLQDLSCIFCDSLAAARKHLDANPKEIFDIVLLDQHLGDGRGLVLLEEGRFAGQAVLAVSSDESPNMPGQVIRAGAAFFLQKTKITEALFQPLVLGLIDRNKIQRELDELKTKATVIDTVRTLVGTLRHEINNPLGAVLGAAYILKNQPNNSPDLNEAAGLVESSGKRIKYVLDELTQAISLESVDKANQKVFHIPGDKPWEGNK